MFASKSFSESACEFLCIPLVAEEALNTVSVWRSDEMAKLLAIGVAVGISVTIELAYGTAVRRDRINR